jgi:plastocyanin
MSARAHVVALAVAPMLFLFACGDDDGGGGAADTLGSPTSPVADVRVVAPAQRFEPSTVFVPAGEPVELTFENDDEGIAHNLRVKTDASADEQPATELEIGPDTQRVTFTLDAGEYRFVCDIHPNMRGTIRAV